MLLNGGIYLAPAIALSSIFLFIIPHIGMALESALTLPKRIAPYFLPLALGWFLFNDSLDYVLGIHTKIPPANIGLVVAFSFGISLFLCFALAHYGERLVKLRQIASLRQYFGRD
jgi:uncharacterized membrane protein YpjA